ncbi:HDOD domain-containing protein [Gemmatimonas sp.]|jgi:HD-like signal output (HDOD) protein|uniref:HDOD domain-containing protein n=1 Tax=Gemmatimonas sp. TaxID=1962908 RepID=UPI0037BF2606
MPGEPSFLEIERQEIGASHEAFGGALCDAWNFPSAFGQACRYHHDFRALTWQEQRLPALMHVADTLAARVGVGYTATVHVDAPLADALALLPLTESELATLQGQVAEAVPPAVSLLAA